MIIFHSHDNFVSILYIFFFKFYNEDTEAQKGKLSNISQLVSRRKRIEIEVLLYGCYQITDIQRVHISKKETVLKL